MKIKVLVVGADVAVGGISGYVAKLAELCDPDRFEFHMTVSGDKGQAAAAPQFDAVVKYPVPITYSLWELPRRAAQLREILRKEQFDLIHLHAARAGLLGCLAAAGLPVGIVYTGHGWRFAQKPDRLRQALFRIPERYICARADAVVFITRRDKDLGLAQGLVDPNRAIVIHTRIDASRFGASDSVAVAAQQQVLGIPASASVIGTVGRLADEKDPLTFIRAAATLASILPHAYFLWVGDGELKDQMLERAREHGLDGRLVVTGLRSADEIPGLLQVMDVYLCTSRLEVMPLSILEAQAARRPIVCAAYPGFEEVLADGETGYVFPSGDGAAAARCIAQTFQHPDESAAMARRAYDRFVVEHADPRKMAREYEEVYARVCVEKSKTLASTRTWTTPHKERSGDN